MSISDQLLAISCYEGYERVPLLEGFKYHQIKQGNDEFVIYYNDKQVILSFTGSDDIKDWFQNTRFIKKQTPYGKIHSGFWESWLTLENKVYEYLHKVEFHTKELYLTGHSMGGCIAMICAVALIYRQYVNKVVTFGSPRVGDKNWKNKYNEIVKCETIRYINGNDLVTKIPSIFYYHVGKSFYFKNNKISTLKFWIWVFFRKRVKSISNHFIMQYVKNLKKHNL